VIYIGEYHYTMVYLQIYVYKIVLLWLCIISRKESMYWGKNGSREHSKGHKTVPAKVATTRTEIGHK